jgi:hypothetical protein
MQTHKVCKPANFPGLALNQENSLENPAQGYEPYCTQLRTRNYDFKEWQWQDNVNAIIPACTTFQCSAKVD